MPAVSVKSISSGGSSFATENIYMNDSYKYHTTSGKYISNYLSDTDNRGKEITLNTKYYDLSESQKGTFDEITAEDAINIKGIDKAPFSNGNAIAIGNILNNRKRNLGGIDTANFINDDDGETEVYWFDGSRFHFLGYTENSDSDILIYTSHDPADVNLSDFSSKTNNYNSSVKVIKNVYEKPRRIRSKSASFHLDGKKQSAPSKYSSSSNQSDLTDTLTSTSSGTTDDNNDGDNDSNMSKIIKYGLITAGILLLIGVASVGGFLIYRTYKGNQIPFDMGSGDNKKLLKQQGKDVSRIPKRNNDSTDSND